MYLFSCASFFWSHISSHTSKNAYSEKRSRNRTDPCLGHLDPTESVLKIQHAGFPESSEDNFLSIWGMMWNVHPTESNCNSPSATLEVLLVQRRCTEVLVLALSALPRVDVTTHCWEGRLAQSCEQCNSNSAAQCHTRGTRLATGFIAAGCCPADTANLLQLWMPISQRRFRGCCRALSRR